ncbi:MAG: hypothetical protein Q4F34_06250 [Prevotellaceae bacterium]|nr:hypothetical protein [Prevotellaceae bacterium]
MKHLFLFLFAAAFALNANADTYYRNFKISTTVLGEGKAYMTAPQDIGHAEYDGPWEFNNEVTTFTCAVSSGYGRMRVFPCPGYVIDKIQATTAKQDVTVAPDPTTVLTLGNGGNKDAKDDTPFISAQNQPTGDDNLDLYTEIYLFCGNEESVGWSSYGVGDETYKNDYSAAKAGTPNTYPDAYVYVTLSKPFERKGLTNGQVGTICLPYATRKIEGATLYTIKSIEMDGNMMSRITFTSVDNAEAGKGYVFMATGEEILPTYDTRSAASTAIPNNGIIGNLSDDPINVTTNKYIVSGNKLVRSAADTGVTIGKNRAYIDPTLFVAADAPAEGKYEFTVDFGEPTAISDVIEKVTAEGQWFNARGEKVAQPTNGVFIKNGVKYIFK